MVVAHMQQQGIVDEDSHVTHAAISHIAAVMSMKIYSLSLYIVF